MAIPFTTRVVAFLAFLAFAGGTCSLWALYLECVFLFESKNPEILISTVVTLIVSAILSSIPGAAALVERERLKAWVAFLLAAPLALTVLLFLGLFALDRTLVR